MALRIILDTMYVIGIISDKKYLPIAQAIDDGKIDSMVSVITITELIKVLGMVDRKKAIKTVSQLKSSKIDIKVLGLPIAEKAGYLRLKYDIPTADSLIGATGIIHKASHILTNDAHFNSIKSLIKPINYSQVLKLIKKL
ncbi:MAG: PIN domain-containing protein [Candidatus Thermoplasmatota archaeon]|nr:PIN domain-containing protein [Candidatus Thermoplasmatota archaeon]MDP7264491.1 PIN domain-containing protein [Candidatus Thermoplasmatota archaeon]